mmetsp:Transcript_82731/g.146057  ORF Transcript_82731/g.146057 Transcript_82731/m.146057 type:complete len:201 (-) Transcript_82731:1472-2074(-)
MMKHPFWVFLVELTVLVDHLRLDPQAKLQAHSIEILCQAWKAPWELRCIMFPITQGCSIIIPPSEPTIIKDQELNAGVFGRLGKLQDLVMLDLKVERLPGIDEHRADQIMPAWGYEPFTQEPVEGTCHSPKTLIGEYTNALWRLESLLRAQIPAEVRVAQACVDTNAACCSLLNLHEPVARVEQAKAVAMPVVFTWRPCS